MKKLPEITMAEWMEAEERVFNNRFAPQPEGSLTAEQYAERTSRSPSQARKVLMELIKAGEAERRIWRAGSGGKANVFVYFLKKKSRTKRLTSPA